VDFLAELSSVADFFSNGLRGIYKRFSFYAVCNFKVGIFGAFFLRLLMSYSTLN
jgi:hypothetical protein